MTSSRVFPFARITGHIAWWIFVVTTLFAGGITWTDAHNRFGDSYIDASFTAGSSGWIAYTPLTDSPIGIANFTGSPPYDRWTDPAFWSLLAFAVVLIAAVIEAISARRLLPGIVTVAAPCVALGLLVLATPGTLDSVALDTMAAMSAVLVAVAIREVWARRFAPRPSLPS
ncbi:hypothetical protein [Williamsia sp.]|uniref:hypothetical protein n=1 Tax=Williamsia sp. TaxID=1872085 RepID=UPI002F952B70